MRAFRIEWLDAKGELLASFNAHRENMIDCLGLGARVVMFDKEVADKVVTLRIVEIVPDEPDKPGQ